MRTDRRRMIRQSVLPMSYDRLEYIENTSTAYIDCGLKPMYTFAYEIKTNIRSSDIILGCKYINDDSDYRIFRTGEGYLYFDVGYKRVMLPKITKPTFHAKFGNYFIESLDDTNNKITGSTFGEDMNKAQVSNIFIFYNGNKYSKGKIWLLKINRNDKTIRDFIPAKRKSDGVVGMYDLVGRKFYISPNGVAFTGG